MAYIQKGNLSIFLQLKQNSRISFHISVL